MASAPCVSAAAHPSDMAQPAITVTQAAATVSHFPLRQPLRGQRLMMTGPSLPHALKVMR